MGQIFSPGRIIEIHTHIQLHETVSGIYSCELESYQVGHTTAPQHGTRSTRVSRGREVEHATHQQQDREQIAQELPPPARWLPQLVELAHGLL